jgi:hypothetical protein
MISHHRYLLLAGIFTMAATGYGQSEAHCPL